MAVVSSTFYMNSPLAACCLSLVAFLSTFAKPLVVVAVFVFLFSPASEIQQNVSLHEHLCFGCLWHYWWR